MSDTSPNTTESTGIRQQFASVDLQELTKRHGTPIYAYDASVIRQRCADLRDWDTVRFAQKACSNLAILDLVRREGVLVDAVSHGEIARAIAAGYSTKSPSEGQDNLPAADPIVYTADIFDHESLKPEKISSEVQQIFGDLDQKQGDVVVAHAWALAEKLEKLGS